MICRSPEIIRARLIMVEAVWMTAGRGLVRAPAFGLQELVTVFGDLLLVIDEAIHDAAAARLDAGTEPSRILPAGLHALLVRQAHFQRVVTRIGDVVLVIEQTINY